MLSFEKPLESVEVTVVQAEPCLACPVCSLDLLLLRLVSPRQMSGPIPPSMACKIPVPEAQASKTFIIPLLPPSLQAQPISENLTVAFYSPSTTSCSKGTVGEWRAF